MAKKIKKSLLKKYHIACSKQTVALAKYKSKLAKNKPLEKVQENCVKTAKDLEKTTKDISLYAKECGISDEATEFQIKKYIARKNRKPNSCLIFINSLIIGTAVYSLGLGLYKFRYDCYHPWEDNSTLFKRRKNGSIEQFLHSYKVDGLAKAENHKETIETAKLDTLRAIKAQHKESFKNYNIQDFIQDITSNDERGKLLFTISELNKIKYPLKTYRTPSHFRPWYYEDIKKEDTPKEKQVFGEWGIHLSAGCINNLGLANILNTYLELKGQKQIKGIKIMSPREYPGIPDAIILDEYLYFTDMAFFGRDTSEPVFGFEGSIDRNQLLNMTNILKTFELYQTLSDKKILNRPNLKSENKRATSKEHNNI